MRLTCSSSATSTVSAMPSPSSRLHFLHGGLGGVLVAVDDDDLGPLLDEGADDPAAQVPAAAGDDRDFPIQHADCHSPYPA